MHLELNTQVAINLEYLHDLFQMSSRVSITKTTSSLDKVIQNSLIPLAFASFHTNWSEQ